MEQIIDPGGDLATFTYDPDDRAVLILIANALRTSHTYDEAGRLLQLYSFDGGNNVATSFDYSYDAVGNKTSQLEAGGDRVTWTYDDAYQLIGERRSGADTYDKQSRRAGCAGLSMKQKTEGPPSRPYAADKCCIGRPASSD